MPSKTPTNSTTAATTFSALPSDILTRILGLLDAPSLAAISSTSSHLHSLSSQSHLWLHLSLSTFPSLHHPLILPSLSTSPRSFFSDAFPFPNPSPTTEPPQFPNSLISAVDIYHRGAHVFSRVIKTDTSSSWFRGSPFIIDAMDSKAEPMRMATMIVAEELRLSWIMMELGRGRAVNVSSRGAVAVERNCYTGERVARFAVVAGEGVIGVGVSCGDGEVREVAMTGEGIEGGCLSGEEGLRLVWGMMEKGRGRGGDEKELKERYLEYLGRKRRRKERRVRREGVLDLCCTLVGVVLFFGFGALLVLR